MQSDFNHIDDFFRRKESEASGDSSMQDKHWQQMKGLLVNPQPVARVRTLNPKLLWQLLVGFSFIAVIGLLVFMKKDGENSPAKIFQKPDVFQSASNDTRKPAKRIENDRSSNSQPRLPLLRSTYAATPDVKQSAEIQAKGYAAPGTVIDYANTYDPIDSSAPVVDPQQAFISFFNELAKKEQEFVINSERDTTVYCKEGTSIIIPAGSFQNSNGSVSGDVVLKVREFYEMTDIIGNKLNTSSNGKQLVTGGMLHLEAMAGGQPVSLKKDVSLQVKMPTQNFDPSMQLFYGKENDLQQNTHDLLAGSDQINWLAAGQQQGFFDNKRLVKVLDVLNDPRKILYRNKRIIAKFILSDNCTLSNDAIYDILVGRYGNKYNEIKVRRGWKTTSKRKRMWEIDGALSDTIRNEVTVNGSSFDYDYSNDGLIGDSIAMTFENACALGLLSKEDSLKWDEIFRKEFELKTGSKSYSDYTQLQAYYKFNVNTLGWINCDKFLAYKNDQKTNFVVDAGTDLNQTYFQSFIVFNKFKSVMSGNWRNGKIIFNDIPLNEKVSVVCVGIKNGKAIYSVKETIVSSSMLTGLEFEETTPADFRGKMKMFGNVQRG